MAATAVPMTIKAAPVHGDPEILEGTPVFLGTRVPVQSLFDYLEGGETLDEFLRNAVRSLEVHTNVGAPVALEKAAS